MTTTDPLAAVCESCYATAQAERIKELATALRGLHDDNIDYLRRNNLGGEDNHWMKTARAVLSECQNECDE